MDLVGRCIDGDAGPTTTGETAVVLGALRLAMQAGDVRASRVMLTRVCVPPTIRDASGAQRVGPPAPELPVLIDHMRRFIAIAHEFAQ